MHELNPTIRPRTPYMHRPPRYYTADTKIHYQSGHDKSRYGRTGQLFYLARFGADFLSSRRPNQGALHTRLEFLIKSTPDQTHIDQINVVATLIIIGKMVEGMKTMSRSLSRKMRHNR